MGLGARMVNAMVASSSSIGGLGMLHLGLAKNDWLVEFNDYNEHVEFLYERMFASTVW